MPKIDDTNTVPEELGAPWLKRFFKRKFDIPVRVKSSSGKAPWISVWISPDPANLHKLVYNHSFPSELGNRCMQVVYPNSEKLREQCWGGNITGHSLAMLEGQWRQVLQQCIDSPIRVPNGD